jgi:molecular chaperone HtpG
MLKIPERFKRKLDNGLGMSEIDYVGIKRRCEQIFEENNSYFFKEYTDHGFRHINGVLEAIDGLIPESTWEQLTCKELVVLLFSTFLHDLGMLIQPLTFKALIDGDYNHLPKFGFKDIEWPILWQDFLHEAKRFSEEEIQDILGVEAIAIEIPSMNDLDNWNENHKKLIGEFIRRHHPRIGFEIAFRGLKSHDGSFIDICQSLNEDYRFLVGVIARSHGMYIRETIPILKRKYPYVWKAPLSIKAVYLMILLRLGDYLQINDSRILMIPYLTKLFKSPLSILEHEKHFCVTDCQPLPDDPEVLYFQANPTNSTLYTSLKKLFKAIQEEFDTSWAVIGEIYGTLKTENRPALRYRRIASNLEDLISNDENLDFVPELIAFSADKELLKLLIAPLYGYNPSFGVRELLQNSVDACWEREFVESQRNELYSGEISIDFGLDKEKRTIFSIVDNGKGMTLEEIKKYFLRAGSSLKKSNEWKKKFHKDHKTPAIHRIGKFGIGVLAAYLLGDEIKVETRHYSHPQGFSFRTRIESKNIEIFKRKDIGIGTKITIYVSDSVRNALLRPIRPRLKSETAETYFSNSSSWDKWFVLRTPKVLIRPYVFPEFSPYNNPDPSPKDTLSEDWNELSTAEFEKILWTYSDKYTRNLLTCNGIVIPSGYSLKKEKASGFSSWIIRPFVSVFDYRGVLKLDLNRNKLLDQQLPFEKELLEAIYGNFLVQALSCNFRVTDNFLHIDRYKFYFSHPGITQDYQILHSSEGYVIGFPFLNTSALSTTYLSLQLDSSELSHATNPRIQLTSKFVSIEFKDRIVEDKDELLGSLIVKSEESKIEGKNYLQRHFVSQNIFQALTYDFLQLRLPSTPAINEKEELFFDFCRTMLGEDTVIPYDKLQRRKKFEKAFDELKIKLPG